MLSAIFITGLAAILPAFAEELRAADVPAACESICESIVKLTGICDVDPNEGDADNDKRRGLRFREVEEADEVIEANCICTNKSFDVASVMALCASCIAQNGTTTEDTDKIMSQCSFTSTSYVASATAQVVGIQVQATKPVTLGEASTSTAGVSSSTSTDTSDAGRGLISGIGLLGAGLMVLAL